MDDLEAELTRCLEAGDPDGGRLALDRLMARDPGSGRWPYERALLESAVGTEDDALRWYREAVARDPAHSDAWVNLGRILDDRRSWDEALACYDRSVALPDGEQDAIAWSNRGNTLMSLERPDEALASFDRALALDPGDPHATLGKRTVLAWVGRLADANAIAPADPADPRHRGEARERRANAGDRDVVARYFVGRHTRPDWLDAEAERLVAGCARLVDQPPGLADGVTVQWGWTNLQVRALGADWVLCEPDFLEAPFEVRVWDVSFTLQTLLMHQMTAQIAEADPVDCRMHDWIGLAPGTLDAQQVVMRRLAPRTEGWSGWVAAPTEGELPDPHSAVVERVRTGELPRLRTPLGKVLLLPPGFTVRFEGHAVTSLIDPAGMDRWA